MAGATPAGGGSVRDARFRPVVPIKIDGARVTILDSVAAKNVGGIALGAHPSEVEPGGLHRLDLIFTDGTSLAIGLFPDDDIVAVWRSLAAHFGTPLLLRHENGHYEPALPQIGRLLVGEVSIRRGHGLLSGRRPRFLKRRKIGRLPARPVVHVKREIGAI